MRIYDYMKGILGAMGVGEDVGVPEPSWRIEEYLKDIYDAIRSGIYPSDEQVAEAIDAWLDDHPEATTTVQDGSITNAKLASSFVTPGTAAAYSSSATYAVGDYVFYGGTMYRCITAITTAEAWTAAHWTQVALGNDVSDLKSAISATQKSISYKIKTPDGISNNYAIKNTGYAVYNENYQAFKYKVSGGDKIIVRSESTIQSSYARYVFQDSATISETSISHLIGEPYTEEIYDEITVPTGANYIIFSVPSGDTETGIYISEQSSLIQEAESDIKDLNTIIDKAVFKSESRISTPEFANNYKLDGTGRCVSASGYRISKWAVNAGSVIWIKASADTEGVYQFQSNKSVPSTLPNANLIGEPVKTAVDGLVVVPDGASWVIISCATDNTVSGLYNYTIETKPFDFLKNIIGMGRGVKYPVYIPSGTSLTMSTKDGEAIGQANLNFLTFDANGNQLQYWNFSSGSSSRTITTSQDAYYVGWDRTPAKEVQVEVGSAKTTYQPYALNITDNEIIKKCLTAIVPPSRNKCQEFSALMYGDTINNVDAPHPCESFLFFTDPHTMEGTGWETRNEELMAQIQRYYNSTPTTFCLCGGDWIGNSDLPADACYKMGYIDGFMYSMFRNCHLLVGNHDTNYQGKKDASSATYTTRLSNDSISDLWYQSKKAYYTFKDGITKFYCFDTGTEGQQLTSYGNYGWEQALWFATSLLTEESEHIAVAAHILYNDLPTNSELHPLMSEILDIAEAYNDRSTISVDGNTFNFASATGKIDFCVCGHSHGDYNGIINGIPYFLTINAGTQSSVASFDLVLVDYSGKKIECVRVGSGSNRTISLETGELIT